MVYEAGAVSAKIILDTEEFEKSIGKLKDEVKDIKKSFNAQVSGGKGLVDEVKQLKEEIDSLKGKLNDYKNTVKSLREENSKYTGTIEKLKKELDSAKKSHSDFNKELKEEQKNLDNASKSASKYVKYADRMTKFSAKLAKENLKEKGMGSLFNLGTGRGKYADFSQMRKGLNTGSVRVALKPNLRYSKELAAELKQWESSINSAKIKYADFINYIRKLQATPVKQGALGGVSTGYKDYLKSFSKLQGEFGKVNNANFTKLSGNLYKNGQLILNWGKDWRQTQQEIQQATTLIRTEFREVDGELEKVTIVVGRATQVLRTFDFQLLATADSETKAYRRTLELASAMQKMNSQGTANWQGRQTTGGYSNYISSINKINQALTRQAELQAKLKAQQLDQYYAKAGAASTKYWNQIRQGTINLNTYKSNLTQITRELDKQTARTERLATAQYRLFQQYHPNNLNYYKSHMNEINQQLERQLRTTDKTVSATKRGQMSMREFGTTMGKAEAYSNNLYRGLQKVRSVIVSMKTIMGAMGGMALWGFASDLIEGAKESYKAKSEMESLLNRNSHVDATGQKIFNEELDKTVEKFQRINKYSLGETASSIGLEFNLNGKQMAKSLDAIAMVQSEYARAGRSNEEAALAVKDILQGEFRRLSMETGIGEEELTGKYGWSGDKEDIEGLMDALRKAGKDRHWDLFASKATSVGDIIAITQSRFSEFGADLITNIEPMIVSGFNGLIEIIDGLRGAFDGMSSFGKLTTIFGGGGAAFVGISTALMMFKRNMGLAEIATLGWGKSFFTALLGLNKTDVAVHGFLKTLTATVSGTNAATVANIGLGKSVLGRLAGVKHEIQAEHGLASALMARKVELQRNLTMEKAAIIESGNLRQKLIYLAQSEVVVDKKSATWGKTLKSLITSTKLLKIAVLGLTSIAILSWFAGVVAYTDRCKKAMDNFNNILSNGSDIADKAQSDVDYYTEKLAGLTEGTKQYNKVARKLETAKLNKEDIDAANELLKIHQRDYEGHKKSIEERRKERLSNSLWLASDRKGAPETDYEGQMKDAIEVRNKALKVYDDRLYSASQRINEQVGLMKEAGVSEEKRLKYVREYQAEADTAARLWKQFNEGDLNSGFYAMLSELKLVWIDLWNNQHFINFWNSVNKTWKELKPTLDWLVKKLGDLGNILLDFFSTDPGRYIGMIGLFGGAIALVGTKIGKFVTGSKSTIDFLKNLKDKLDIGGRKWKWWGDKAEEAGKKVPKTDTSPDGIPGETKGTGSLTGDLKEIGKTRAKSFANNALIIAEGMLLVTEAIVLLRAPMAALTELGWQYKQWEPDLRKGIEGLQLISPIIVGFLVPIIALHQILSKYGKFMDTKGDFINNLKAFGTMVLGIAEGMFLVAETITMIIPSIWALGALGDQFSGMQEQVRKGTEAMKIVSDSLYYLLPFIPALAGGILLGIAVFESGPIGAALSVAVAGGIAIGIGLVAEAIWLLQAPLWAIGDLGNKFQDLSNVQRGAEAIRLTADALKSVAEAMSYLALIDISLLSQTISDVVSQWLGVDLGGSLSDLTAEGGVISQLNTFAQEFNKFEFEPIQQDKVTALATAGDGVKTIGDAMVKVKDAMNNLPDEFKNPQTTLTYNKDTDKISVATEDTTGYFDTFKEPLKQLKDFVYDFNHSDDFNIEVVDTGRLSAINSAADMITQINTAVENVKTAMQNVGNAQWETSYAEGGIFAAAGNFIYHATGIDSINNGSSSGSYKSSLGSSLQAMEDIISDMFTFQSNISQYSGGEGGEGANVGGLSNMITIVQDAISKLSQTLSDGVPTIKQNGNSLGSAIVKGFKEGSVGINSVGSGIPAKIANGIMTNKDMVYNTSNSLGKTTATKFKEGVNPMSDYMTWELSYVKEAMTSRYDELGQTAYDLGAHIAARFKEGDDINSPGIMARSIQDEIGYIGNYLGVNNLPQMAFDLANSLASNFNVDFNLSSFHFPDVTQWASQLGGALPIINGFKTQVSTNFEGMKLNVQNSFNNILNKTRTTMSNMKAATIGHIGNIKSSWHGMQDALIASAEHIKSQTTSKIDTLKTNLGQFWNKVRNPDQLIGSAGPLNHQGSIRRRSRPHFNVPKGNYAGGFDFKPRKSRGEPTDLREEYLKCIIETGKPCYAGGWNFDWTDKISNKFKGWKTHFAKFHLDDYLNVGKFEHDNFPVRGNAEIAKAYIYDVISATQYGKYVNSHFGDDPVAALRAGVFNCWDGANIILAIARAFGFYGSMGHGSWNGIGHVWAAIPGLGNIDATAIQGGYGFTSPKVTGYAGPATIRRGGSNKVPDGTTGNTNHNEVHIHIEGDVYGIDDLNSKIEEGANRVARQLFRDSYSGV